MGSRSSTWTVSVHLLPVLRYSNVPLSWGHDWLPKNAIRLHDLFVSGTSRNGRGKARTRMAPPRRNFLLPEARFLLIFRLPWAQGRVQISFVARGVSREYAHMFRGEAEVKKKQNVEKPGIRRLKRIIDKSKYRSRL